MLKCSVERFLKLLFFFYLEENLKQQEAEKEICRSELTLQAAKCSELESTVGSLREKIVQYEQEIAASTLRLASATEDAKETLRLQESIQVWLLSSIVVVIHTVLTFRLTLNGPFRTSQSTSLVSVILVV
jgi:hypothetical protein